MTGPLFEQLAADPWGRLVLQSVASGGMHGLFVFLLVVSRLAGLFLVAPRFSDCTIPFAARLGLTLVVSLIIAPALATIESGDLVQAGFAISHPQLVPEAWTDLICLLLVELGFGILLGMGPIVVFGGLRLASEWLERHGGFARGSNVGAERAAERATTDSLFELLGLAALLTMDVAGGHWQLLQALFQSFQLVPVGGTTAAKFDWEMPVTMIQQACLLGLHVAVPFAATMILIETALAFAGRGAPYLETSFLAIRLTSGLTLLCLSMTAIPEIVRVSLTNCLQCVMR